MCVKEGWVVDLLGLIAEEAGGCVMLGLPLVVGLWLGSWHSRLQVCLVYRDILITYRTLLVSGSLVRAVPVVVRQEA